MTKNELKNIIKTRVENQRQAVRDKRTHFINSVVEETFHEIYSKADLTKMTDAVRNASNVMKSFSDTIGNVINIADMHYEFGSLACLEDKLQRDLRSLLWNAHSQDWTCRDVSRRINWYHESQKPKIKAAYDKIYKADCVKIEDLHKLEGELLAIVRSSKTAMVAIDTLKELGIKFDIPEAVEVKVNLPAVIKLSVSAELFNTSLTTNNN